MKKYIKQYLIAMGWINHHGKLDKREVKIDSAIIGGAVLVIGVAVWFVLEVA